MKNSINIFSETGCITHEVLWKYRQGKLTAAEKHTVEVHLTDCELCSDALAGMMNMQSDEMMAGLRKSVHKISAPKKVIRFYDYRILSAAAAAAGVVIIFTYIINSPKSDKKEIAQVVVPKQELKKNEEQLPSPPHPIEQIKSEQPKKVKDSVSPQSTYTYNGNFTSKAITSNAISTPALPPSAKENLSVASDTAGRQTEAVTSNFTLDKTVSGNARSGYATPAQTVRVEKNADESPGIATTKSVLRKKSLQAEPSKITYFNDLKVSVTRAMSPDEKFDSVNTGIPAMFENENKNKTTSEMTMARERPFVYSKTLRDGINYFHDTQYQYASQIFDIILERLPDDVNSQFYKGLSEMELHNYKVSSDLLNKAMLNSDKTFYEEAKFKLALCYVALNKKEDAEKLLREIVAEKGFYSREASEKLLELK